MTNSISSIAGFATVAVGIIATVLFLRPGAGAVSPAWAAPTTMSFNSFAVTLLGIGGTVIAAAVCLKVATVALSEVIYNV